MNDERSANAVDRRLGLRLRTRRIELGMSQERLAELLGVTFQQVQKYEKGINRVAASRLFEVAAALGVPLSYFFEGMTAGLNAAPGVSEGGIESDMFEALSSPEAVHLLTLFQQLRSPKVRRRVVELVRALAEEEDEAQEPSQARG
jgi:transcriptional regulator with XRE-family HTH domain